MYRCNCCGREFAEPKPHEEDRGEYFGFPAKESVLGCPYCGGGYTSEPEPVLCVNCGKETGDDYPVCDDCIDEAERLIGILLAQLSPEMLKALEDRARLYKDYLSTCLREYQRWAKETGGEEG